MVIEHVIRFVQRLIGGNDKPPQATPKTSRKTSRPKDPNAIDAATFFSLVRSGRAPARVHIQSSLSFAGTRVRRLPSELVIDGDLDLRQCERLRFIGDGLQVDGDLRIGGSCSAAEVSPGTNVLRRSRDKHSPLIALPNDLVVGGSLFLNNCTHLRAFPARATIGGSILLSGNTSLASLPEGLHVRGNLTILGGPALTALPRGLRVDGDLRIVGTQIDHLPADLDVRGNITLVGCRKLLSLDNLTLRASLEVHHFRGQTLPHALVVPGDFRLVRPRELVEIPSPLRGPPEGVAYRIDVSRDMVLMPGSLRVGGDLFVLDALKLATIREGITVGKNLHVHRCAALTQLPAGLTVPGRLSLRGCTALAALPSRLRAQSLDLTDCKALTTLPSDLHVAGAVEVLGSGLPPGFRSTRSK